MAAHDRCPYEAEVLCSYANLAKLRNGKTFIEKERVITLSPTMRGDRGMARHGHGEDRQAQTRETRHTAHPTRDLATHRHDTEPHRHPRAACAECDRTTNIRLCGSGRTRSHIGPFATAHITRAADNAATRTRAQGGGNGVYISRTDGQTSTHHNK